CILWTILSLLFRYSYWHSHFYALLQSFLSSFAVLSTLSYHVPYGTSTISVMCLASLHFRRRITRLVSYYALFKWWLLLSQHPSCLCNSTSFSTSHLFWDLNRWSGLFPFRLRILSLAV